MTKRKHFNFKELLILSIGYFCNVLLRELKYKSKYLPLKREIYYFLSEGFQVVSKRKELLLRNSDVFSEITFKVRKHTSDMFVFRQVIINKEYKPIINLINSEKERKSINFIVDAGANVGLTSLFFHTYWKDSKIVAIEPEDSNYKQLIENIHINDLTQKIIPIKKALWINNTEKLMIYDGFRDGKNWAKSVKTSEEDGKTEPITLSTLLDIYSSEKIIDILKIDIEGSEYQLFKSNDFLEILTTSVRFLCIEIHEEFMNRIWYYDVLEKINFKSFDVGETTFSYNQRFYNNL